MNHRPFNFSGAIPALIAAVLMTGGAIAHPVTPFDLKPSRNLSNTPQPTRAEYLAKYPEHNLTVRSITHHNPRHQILRDEVKGVVILVNQRLHEIHAHEITDWVADLNAEGWQITLIDADGGTPQDVKNLILQQGGDDLAGVIFLGEFPLAWFEQLEYFDDHAIPDNNNLESYPIDLFFTDRDGVWADADTNGIYDSHTGNWEPELWLGRIAAYNLARLDEDELVSAYLARIHSYRLGELHLPHRALSFTDDDWVSKAVVWQHDGELAYGRVELVAEPESTSSTAYQAALTGDGYELVQVAVHSSADSHAFFINHRHDLDYFRFRHLRDEITPKALFYNLFACSAMNLSGNLSLGALYSIKEPFALGAVGSTKTGGMLFFDDFYRPLGEGVPIGESLRRWMSAHAQEPGHEHWAQSWFYGMTCFGDPTLSIHMGLGLSRIEVQDQSGDGDSNADAGESFGLAIRVRNRGLSEFEVTNSTLVSKDSTVTVEAAERQFGIVAPDGESDVASWNLAVPRSTPNGHVARFELAMHTSNGETWWSPITLTTFAPVVSVREIELNVNGRDSVIAGPREAGELIVMLENLGGDDARQEMIECRSLDGLVEFSQQQDSLGELQSALWKPINFNYLVSGEAVATDVALVELQASEEGVQNGREIIALPLSVDASFSDNFDDSITWMVHSPVKEGFADVWRWDSTAGEGSGGISFGGPDSLKYPAQADAVFELPAMMLGAGARLLIRHKLDAEPEYDAATVEVKHDGIWRRVAPIGGYNGTGAPNGSFEGGECWNDSFDWRSDEVVLNETDGLVKVRLRFSSDEGIEDSGWRIDQLTVVGHYLKAEEESRNLPVNLSIVKAFPNPFNSTLTIEIRGKVPEKLGLYDLQGRLVRTIDISSLGTVDKGMHLVSINQSDLAAGVYYLRWQQGVNSGTLKTALVK